MTRFIVPEFAKFKEEGILIGRIIAGYSSIENALASCVAMGKSDLDMVIKVMYRARGETQRIDVADAIGRPTYASFGLEDMFSEAIADLRFCLKVRNQYAHSFWHDDNTSRLCFVDMEEIAKRHTIIYDLKDLTFHYLDTALLQLQEDYFLYVGDCFLYLNYEGRKLRDLIRSHSHARPKKLPRPQTWLP